MKLGTGLGLPNQQQGRWSDPLAGLTLPFRLQTHYGDGVSVGVYQDAACTIPAEEWSDVKGIYDGLTNNSIQATQAGDPSWAPILIYENGMPIIRFDGINDRLDAVALGTIGGQVTFSALMKSNTSVFNSYYSPLESTALDTSTRWGIFSDGNTGFHSDPYLTAVVRDGVSRSYPAFDLLPPINVWMTITVTTATAAVPANRAIGQLQQYYFGDFDLIALIVHSPVDTAVVQSYLSTLKP